jgi:hypothetical protein
LHIHGGLDEYVAALDVDDARDLHVLELLLILVVDSFQVVAVRFLTQDV